MDTAVLVIDVQQGLCDGPTAAYDCAGTIRRINTVTHKARKVGVPVVFIQHESDTGALVHGSNGWQLADGLETADEDHFIRKTTPDAFLGTGLQALLDRCKVRRLVVCGMHTEYCVDTTVRSALALGFPVVLVSDAHTSAGNDLLSPQQVIAHHTITLATIASFGPRVTAMRSLDVTL